MNNLVSVRIQNKYKTSFSLSHYLKHSHSTISKKVKTYCLVNNLDCKNLKYEQEYQIIKSINKVNYFINENGTKTPFRRDITQEIYLLQKMGRTDEIKILKDELSKLDNELFNPVNKKFKDEIQKVNDDYKIRNKRKLRSDAVINYSGVITFGNEESNLSRNEMDNLNQDKLDKNRINLIKNILKDLGIPDNAYILTKHLDEQQIHYHFEFIGYCQNRNKEYADVYLENDEIIAFLATTISAFQNFYKVTINNAFFIKEAVENTVLILNSSIRKYQIDMNVNYKNSDRVVIIGQRNVFSQVVLTILENAISIFLERDTEYPKIDINMENKNDKVIVTIEDNAGGIEKENIPHIFEQSKSFKQTPSSGLGLYIAKLVIVEKLQGDITVENGKEGAIFTITLPCSEE